MGVLRTADGADGAPGRHVQSCSMGSGSLLVMAWNELAEERQCPCRGTAEQTDMHSAHPIISWKTGSPYSGASRALICVA